MIEKLTRTDQKRNNSITLSFVFFSTFFLFFILFYQKSIFSNVKSRLKIQDIF